MTCSNIFRKWMQVNLGSIWNPVLLSMPQQVSPHTLFRESATPKLLGQTPKNYSPSHLWTAKIKSLISSPAIHYLYSRKQCSIYEKNIIYSGQTRKQNIDLDIYIFIHISLKLLICSTTPGVQWNTCLQIQLDIYHTIYLFLNFNVFQIITKMCSNLHFDQCMCENVTCKII